MLSLSAWCQAWHVACSLKNPEVCSLHSSQLRHYSAAISPYNCYGLAANVIEEGGWTGFIELSVGRLKTALSCREISELQLSEQEICRVNKGQRGIRRIDTLQEVIMLSSLQISKTSHRSSGPYNFLVNKEVNFKSSAYRDKSENTRVALHINSIKIESNQS